MHKDCISSLLYCSSVKSSTRFLSSRVFADKEAMIAGALEMAGEIAGRSPVAVQGTKINLIYARDHSVAEGLDYMVRMELFSEPPQSHHEAALTPCASCCRLPGT